MELKGLKLLDIENNGYSMTLEFEGGYVLEVSPDNYGDSVKGIIKQVKYEKVGEV